MFFRQLGVPVKSRGDGFGSGWRREGGWRRRRSGFGENGEDVRGVSIIIIGWSTVYCNIGCRKR